MKTEKEEKMRSKLLQSLQPLKLEIINQSALHKGHAGYDGSGESHFKLIIVSGAFEGMSRIQRHRYVRAIIEEEAEKIHALSIEAYAPLEKTTATKIL